MTARNPNAVLTPEKYMDGIAQTAFAIIQDLRDINPYELLRELTVACESEPQRMAQVVMALAAMMPTDETTATITARVWAITRSVA